MMTMIEIKNLSHRYGNRSEYALKNINLKFSPGETVFLMGPSGSGKSTLMKCINRLVEPLEGSILFDGMDILEMAQKDVERTRREIGMIFQEFNLFERKSVWGNVEMGRLGYISLLRSILLMSSGEDSRLVEECIKRVNMHEFKMETVSNLSGGQKQRVAIARALAQKPKVILADEPVSALDPSLQKEIMNLLQKICKEDNITLLISLHHIELVKKYADRIIGLKCGEVIFNTKPNAIDEDLLGKIYGNSESKKGARNECEQ